MEYVKRCPTRWRKALAGMIFASACLLACPGCGTRTILVPPGEPVRLRQTIKGAKVWVAGKNGKEVSGTVDLPEGWYALPDTGNKDP